MHTVGLWEGADGGGGERRHVDLLRAPRLEVLRALKKALLQFHGIVSCSRKDPKNQAQACTAPAPIIGILARSVLKQATEPIGRRHPHGCTPSTAFRAVILTTFSLQRERHALGGLGPGSLAASAALRPWMLLAAATICRINAAVTSAKSQVRRTACRANLQILLPPASRQHSADHFIFMCIMQ